MSILETLQNASNKVVNDYVASFPQKDAVPKHRQLDVIKLRNLINTANDANALRGQLRDYSAKLIESFWWWVPFTGSRLGYSLKNVLDRNAFSENNILQAQVSEMRVTNSNVTSNVNSQWVPRMAQLEQKYEHMQVQLQTNQSEIGRLRHENESLLVTLRQIDEDKTRYWEELVQLRNMVQSLQQEKAQAVSELESLRIENQRLREIVTRFGVNLTQSGINQPPVLQSSANQSVQLGAPNQSNVQSSIKAY